MASYGDRDPVQDDNTCHSSSAVYKDKKRINCTQCSKTFSSKRRLDGHVNSRHGLVDHPGVSKQDCYTAVDTLGSSSRYQCNICKKHLSSKQRIEHHLFTSHNKSPVQKVYNTWKEEKSSAIPLSTRKRRLQLFEDLSDTEIVDDVMDCDVDIQMSNTSSGSEEFSGSDYLSASSEESDTDSSNFDSSTDEPVMVNSDMLTESEAQAYCKISYALRHNISGNASDDLTKLLNICSANKSKFELPIEKPNFKRIHYCSLCDAIFPALDEFTCNTAGCHGLQYQGGILSQTMSNRQPKASFILAGVQSQLKQVLGRKGIWESIQKTKERTRQPKTSICDIVDGDCYRDYCRPGQFLHNTNNISAIFNTDGIPLYSSSKVKLWPIFLAINELPVSCRFSRENLLLAGIWQGKVNPPFIHYMYAFSEQMNDLYNDGFPIEVGENIVNVKMAVVCSTMDLQAKAYVLNMTMHNGKFGCCTCEEEGKVVPQGKGHTRCYPYKQSEERAPLRQSSDIKLNKAPTANIKQKQKGVAGISGLSVMPYFNLVDGVLPDYMHGVLLGVTKTLLKLWFSSNNSKKAFYIGDRLGVISSRHQNIRPPDYIERLPRDLAKHYVNFKATELQTWLLFYAIPCLGDILPAGYFKHLCLLSEAVYILLSDNITDSDLENAETLLDEFYKNFEELYGQGSCGLNVHNTGAHLASYVRRWGPIWAWSCFPFEDANAAILQAVHGTGDICIQYLNHKHLEGIVSNLDLHRCPSQEIKNFLTSMRKRDKVWSSTKEMANCITAGATHAVNPEEVDDNILRATGAGQSSELTKVLRVGINGQKIYSEQYGRMKRRNCYTVCTNDGQIVQINYFVANKSTQMVYAVGKQILLAEECLVNERCLHVIKVKSSDVRLVIEISKISEKVFQISIDNDIDNIFVCRMPNILGHGILK